MVSTSLKGIFFQKTLELNHYINGKQTEKQSHHKNRKRPPRNRFSPSICMPDESNPFSLHCNIVILSGIYQGILLHLEMQVPENYPIQAPSLRLSPDQAFNGYS